jgi:hypothetical protein
VTAWVRTFPAEIPPGRGYVVDELPQVTMTSYNYVPVMERLARVDGDAVIVEWDIAFSPEDREAFDAAIAVDPQRVHVVPYRLYPRSTNLPEPVWAHRAVGRLPPWITEQDQACDLFSFGLVYLPAAVVRWYLSTGPEVTGDAVFSQWHHDAGLGPVPVHWDVRPVHLHY